MSKKILLSDSQIGLMEGINLLADAVKSTLGPSGMTVIISDGINEPYATKDGVTVAKQVHSDDPVMNVGIQMVKKVSVKMDEDSGDGTTTATVLCRALLVNAMRAKEEDSFNYRLFKEYVEKQLIEIEKFLKENSITVPLEDIWKVALTSSNNDVEISKLFQEAFNNVKKDGYINILETRTGKSYISLIKGFVVEMGYADRKFANNIVTGFFEAANCKVILYDNDFNDRREMLKLIERSTRKNPQPILIIAKDFSKDVESIVEFNNSDRLGIKICLIKNQYRNSEYYDYMNDISNYTGAEIIQNFDEFDTEFGDANNVVVKQGFTVFGDCEGTQLEILEGYIALLEMAANEEKSPSIAQSIRKRIDKMKNGITTFYVGGDSDIEIAEKRDRVEDAYKACKQALNEGIVVGGGQALAMYHKQKTAISLQKLLLEDRTTLETKCRMIFGESIMAPFDVILSNSLHNEKEIQKIFQEISFENGYNARTRKFENLYESGIVDPINVTINGLRNAISIALTILSTECLIVDTQNN